MDAAPGTIRPSASASTAIVEAVPIVLHAPQPWPSASSSSRHPASSSRPARRSSHIRHRSVPAPSARPRNIARGRAPPVTSTVGTLALIAPISAPGTLLSQLASTTRPSSGLARTISSTSMASRLRYSIALGFIRSSPSEIVGNSAGAPPAARTPSATATASCRSGRLHGLSWLAELAIPITGRPWPAGTPAEVSATRLASATSSSPRSHFWLRKLCWPGGPPPGTPQRKPGRVIAQGHPALWPPARTGSAPARCAGSTPA